MCEKILEEYHNNNNNDNNNDDDNDNSNDNSALGTFPIGWVMGLVELEISGRIETIQTTVLLRLSKILRRVLVTWGTLLVSQTTGMKISQEIKSNNNNLISKLLGKTPIINKNKAYNVQWKLIFKRNIR